MKVIHTLKPIYDRNSKVLILGTMPSVKSREIGFYYMHPQNRFWKTMSLVYKEKIGDSINEKITFLNKYHIALWDVLSSCDIMGSSDTSIKNIIVNDINNLIKNTKIKYVFTTGKKAFQLYNKYCLAKTKIDAILLPSPSSANCAMHIDKLVENYQIIKIKTEEA